MVLYGGGILTGKTHRAGGMLCSVVGFAVLKENGVLFSGVNEGLQWLVMFPFCVWGSVANDLDQPWESCPARDFLSWLINKALHITAPIQRRLDGSLSAGKKRRSHIYRFCKLLNASHRSWQTHSDLTALLVVLALGCVTSKGFAGLGAVDMVLLGLVMMGVGLGVLTHLVLDCLTPLGIHLVFASVLNKLLRHISPRLKLPEKLRLVPKRELFVTSGKWEALVCRLLQVATVVAVIWVFLLPLLPFEIV